MHRTLASVLALWAAPVAAQELGRNLEFPTYPLGPPVVALGGAGTAWAHDAAGSLNPATLLAAPRVSIYHYEGFADYGGDFAAGSVPLFRRFALGVSLRRFGWDRVIEDDLGVPIGDLSTGDAQYTVTLAAAPVSRVHVGAAVSRFVSDNIGVRIAGTGWSFGGTVQYAEGGHAGLALLHLGSATSESDGERYELPATLRVGFRQRVPGALSLVADGAWPLTAGGAWTGHAGIEWQAPAFVVLRAGIESLASAASVERETRGAAGLGLIVGPLEVSLTTRFGGIAGSQEWFVGLDALRPKTHTARRAS